MAIRKKVAPTKTLSFRVDAMIYDKVIEAAKSRRMSLGEYILAQINPASELGAIMQIEQSKVLLQEEIIQTGLIDFITGLVNIKEQNGLDNESFTKAIKDSFSAVVQSKTGSSK